MELQNVNFKSDDINDALYNEMIGIFTSIKVMSEILAHNKDELVKYNPMTIKPKRSHDPSYSETVMAYDEDNLEYPVMAFYQFEDEAWHVLDDNSTKLICWTYIECPSKEDVKGFVHCEHVGFS